MKLDMKIALGLGAVIVAGAVSLFVKSGPAPRDVPLPTISAAPPVLSARPTDAPAASASSAAPEPDSPDYRRLFGARMTPDDLMRNAVGRWRAPDGAHVEVEPPRDRDGDRPPYKIVLRGAAGLPRSGYGCEMAVMDHTDPKRIVDGAVYYAAWCERGKRATVAVTLDTGLSVAILSEGRVKARVDGAVRADGDRRAP